MFSVKSLIKDEKVCTKHIHLIVIALIEFALVDCTPHTFQGGQYIVENIAELQLMDTVENILI